MVLPAAACLCQRFWSVRSPLLTGRLSQQGTLRKCSSRAAKIRRGLFLRSATPSNPRGIGLVTTDFDGTCSDGDSIDLLLMALMKSASERVGPQIQKGEYLKERLRSTQLLAEEYSSEYTKVLKTLLSSNDYQVEGSTLSSKDRAAAFLAPLSSFEEAWTKRVEDSGVLKDAVRKHIIEEGKQIPLQENCLNVLEQVRLSGWGMHVTSVNWSAEYIGASLGPKARVAGRSWKSGEAGSIFVHADELEYDGGISTGKLSGSLQSADDKLEIFKELQETYTKKNDGRNLSVYIGDSLTDLPALLEADFGIIVGGSGSLTKCLELLGIGLEQLSELIETPVLEATPMLYQTVSWKEIEQFLFGSSEFSEELKDKAYGVPRVLIVAGSDSGGGAGIQADLKTCMMTGSFGTTAISALTAQNTHGVTAIHSAPIDHFKSQMTAVLSDIGTDAVKTGALPSPGHVKATAEVIEEYSLRNVVVDPVMVSTSGAQLATNEVLPAYKDYLIPLATVLTPNIPEAEALLGGRKIITAMDMEAAVQDLLKLGPKHVLLKGGHFSQDLGALTRIVDFYTDGSTVLKLYHRSVKTGNTHGTGCTLASAIASNLAQGQPVLSAIVNSQEYVLRALLSSSAMKVGNGVQRPFNHGFSITDWIPSGIPGNGKKELDLRVYPVTDAKLNTKMGRSITDAVAEAIRGGATIVQIREKDSTGRVFADSVKECVTIGRRAGVPIIVNDRIDIALTADADGVHIGQDDICASDVRRLVGPTAIVGVSASNVEEAIKAERDGADYIGAGAVFPSGTKPESSSIGLNTLREVCDAVSIPVVAIGGITVTNAASTIEAGCGGVAIVAGIFGNDDIHNSTEGFRTTVTNALTGKIAV